MGQMTFAVPKCASSGRSSSCSGGYNASHNYVSAGTYTAILYGGRVNTVLGTATVVVA
jgi:PKD repeat protein